MAMRTFWFALGPIYLTNKKIKNKGDPFDEKYLAWRRMVVVINQGLDKVSACVITLHVVVKFDVKQMHNWKTGSNIWHIQQVELNEKGNYDPPSTLTT
jgi:hypothetical protein